VSKLKSKDQEVRETAALSIGIAGIKTDAAIETLISIINDSKEGRKLCDREEVDDRTRVFATYALGLLANYNIKDDVLRKKAIDTFKVIIANSEISTRNMKVAAINAMGLLK
jgi:HEAT repeat protein